jgi:hypothetical protein
MLRRRTGATGTFGGAGPAAFGELALNEADSGLYQGDGVGAVTTRPGAMQTQKCLNSLYFR